MTVRELWYKWENWDESLPVMFFTEGGDWINTFRNYEDIAAHLWNMDVYTFGLTPIGAVRYAVIACEV